MPKSEQGVFHERYQVIPRTLIFITRGDEVLLLKGAAHKRLWANKFNGIGGHVERHEDVLTAARRELNEEAGISADLRLAGTVLIDVQPEAGIAIYVFRGEYAGGELQPSEEGELCWVKQAQIASLPLVEDLVVLLPRLFNAEPGSAPFSALYWYDEAERLRISFAD